MNSERRILIARVVGAFGVRGEVKLQSFTDPLSAALKYQPWLLVHRHILPFHCLQLLRPSRRELSCECDCFRCRQRRDCRQGRARVQMEY